MRKSGNSMRKSVFSESRADFQVVDPYFPDVDVQTRFHNVPAKHRNVGIGSTDRAGSWLSLWLCSFSMRNSGNLEIPSGILEIPRGILCPIGLDLISMWLIRIFQTFPRMCRPPECAAIPEPQKPGFPGNSGPFPLEQIWNLLNGNLQRENQVCLNWCQFCSLGHQHFLGISPVMDRDNPVLHLSKINSWKVQPRDFSNPIQAPTSLSLFLMDIISPSCCSIQEMLGCCFSWNSQEPEPIHF